MHKLTIFASIKTMKNVSVLQQNGNIPAEHVTRQKYTADFMNVAICLHLETDDTVVTDVLTTSASLALRVCRRLAPVLMDI